LRWRSGRGGGDQTGEARSGCDRKGTALTEHRGGIRGGDATPTRAFCDAACRRCKEGGVQRRKRHPDRIIIEGGVSDRRRSDRW
ncbi:MAG: hypothetical protein WBF05_06440, partial [Anaerolineales bacterium]